MKRKDFAAGWRAITMQWDDLPDVVQCELEEIRDLLREAKQEGTLDELDFGELADQIDEILLADGLLSPFEREMA